MVWTGALVIFVVPLATSCTTERVADSSSEQTAQATDEIVNGTPSTVGYAGYLSTSRGHCTATLVGRKTALTAAHCFNPGELSATFCIVPTGVAGASGYCSSGTAIINPNFDGDGDHDDDVAVVRLMSDMTLATTHSAKWPAGVMPLLIGGPVQDGEIVTLTGYGCDNEDTETGKGFQRTGENSISEVHDLTFEANDSSRANSCEGDSGGPATLPSGCEVGLITGIEWYFSTTHRFNRLEPKVSWIQSVANDASVRECGSTSCGDGLCQGLETCSNCPSDCTTNCPRCGDGRCDTNETHSSCPADCHAGACQVGKSDCCGTGACYTQAACQHLGCL